MTTKSATLRAESHSNIGTIIQRDAGLLIQRWAARAAEEQPSAKRVHHHILLDHLPVFLWDLGRSLSSEGDSTSHIISRPAREHGDQRWDAGWSIVEVVRDYQILRIVLTEHLEAELEVSMSSRETLALGVALDDAIASSISSYVAARRSDSGSALSPSSTTPPAPARDDFFAILGHELRGPLAPIWTALEVLQLRPGEVSRVKWARELIERQVKQLARLVEDMLDVQRISRGKIILRHEKVDLTQLVRQIAEDRRGGLERAGLSLVVDIPSEIIQTNGDSGRLAQAIGNLLSNAEKFTERNGVVTVQLGRDESRRTAMISIRDTGVGIEPHLIDRVFETFMQADRAVERSRGGLGIGLALVKGFVELHGGNVRVKSDGLGKGSEFVLELPILDVPHVGEASLGTGPDSLAHRILVIEDNADSADTLKVLLELHGHRVEIAGSGAAALAIMPVLKPSVVICDLGLPGMNGYAVCTALRRLPESTGVLFIALSGHGSPSDHQRGVESGFDLHLIKPVDPSDLMGIVREKAIKQENS